MVNSNSFRQFNRLIEYALTPYRNSNLCLRLQLSILANCFRLWLQSYRQAHSISLLSQSGRQIEHRNLVLPNQCGRHFSSVRCRRSIGVGGKQETPDSSARLPKVSFSLQASTLPFQRARLPAICCSLSLSSR